MAHAPPPPPAAAPARYTAKPVPAPSKKMKQLFWDVVPYIRLHGTFWVEPEPEPEPPPAGGGGEGEGEGGGGGSEGPPTLDWTLMEEMFAQVVRAAPTPAKAAAGKQAQSVIDGKKAYKISILMGSKIKISVDALRARVVQLDPRVFDSEEAVDALQQCVPSPEDAAALVAYRDSGKPLEDLGEAERVCLQLMSVPAVETRLKVYAYKFTTPHKLNSARQVFSANLRAIEAMRCSPMFRRALRLALHAGNFMNHGSRLGNAVGFRLKALPKLGDTKSADGKHTLLSMLALEAMRLSPPPAAAPAAAAAASPGAGAAGAGPAAPSDTVLGDEMGALSDPMLKVSHAEADGMVAAAEGQVAELRAFLEGYTPITDAGVEDTFATTMTAELEALEAACAEVRGMQTSMLSQYEALLKYFGENLNSTPSDTDFWAATAAFVDKFSGAQKALVAERKEKEEREARRRQREAAEAEKARKVSMKRQETLEARERLLAGRTPTKPPGPGQPPHPPGHPGGGGQPTPAGPLPPGMPNAMAAAAALVVPNAHPNPGPGPGPGAGGLTPGPTFATGLGSPGAHTPGTTPTAFAAAAGAAPPAAWAPGAFATGSPLLTPQPPSGGEGLLLLTPPTTAPGSGAAAAAEGPLGSAGSGGGALAAAAAALQPGGARGWRTQQDAPGMFPNDSPAATLRANSFVARLSEAGFSPTSPPGSGSGGLRESEGPISPTGGSKGAPRPTGPGPHFHVPVPKLASSHAPAAHPHHHVPPAPTSARHPANALGSPTLSHPPSRSTGSGAHGHPHGHPHGDALAGGVPLPARASSATALLASTASAGADDDRALREAKHASNSALAAILMNARRGRDTASDAGAWTLTGSQDLALTAAAALASRGSAGSAGGGVLRGQGSDALHPEGLAPGTGSSSRAGSGMGAAGVGPGGRAARERHEDWSIRIAVEDLMQNMLDDLAYGID